ncbi:hypothetical protein SBD_0226 [Streptomyces bottropensis ATCC 25435]|uniref:Uncharacterized protein n=1 Tax=Streptomyces bottropensis ATCC 25435 TaxID=1054862 RepID=M3FZ54_9ACTN|nr:hypothetical protein SBD_0226 [Streptomyces bottropensis ATCC 25435]
MHDSGVRTGQRLHRAVLDELGARRTGCPGRHSARRPVSGANRTAAS